MSRRRSEPEYLSRLCGRRNAIRTDILNLINCNESHMSIHYNPYILEEEKPRISPEPDKEGGDDSTPATHDWLGMLFINTRFLVLHVTMTACVTCFMLLYVDGNYFNLSNRRPMVLLAGGTSVPSTRSLLLQSDVVTILSSAIILLRLALGAWSTALCWRSALFLMERRGLSRSSLRWLIGAGVLTPPLYARDIMTFLTGVTLLVTLAANFISPLLTGSISWVPSNQPAVFIPESAGVKVSIVEFREFWTDYLNLPKMREQVVQMSAGAINTAWGRNTDKDVLKRAVSFATGLELNSTITNVTLPHFVVHSLDWIKDPYETLTPDQRNFTLTVNKMASLGPTRSFQWTVGDAMLVPTTNWTSIPNPSPAMVEETRLLLFYHSWLRSNFTSTDGQSGLFLSDTLPSEMGVVREDGRLYSLAQVTFSAGVSRCNNCRLSGPSTVQNDTALALQADSLTNEALALAPQVAGALVIANSSIPFPMNNVNNYVEALLVRSYSGAWNALSDYIGSLSVPLTSSYHASFQVLGARVNKERVYIWLGLQLSATFFGMISLFVQSRAKSKNQFIGDTALTAFYLNTSEVPVKRNDPAFKEGMLKVRVIGDRLKVEVEN
ncbi:unnamed protein product [Rhizoctonia solani]|uniref:Transmembrane protein n=1 Tax=Rhizoctonia solani TaxID=456999 RepID=A0A8H3GPQ5_9AGAM|nr:unnamed protein product [Rhizoctonia solani]